MDCGYAYHVPVESLSEMSPFLGATFPVKIQQEISLSANSEDHHVCVCVCVCACVFIDSVCTFACMCTCA